MDCDLDFGLLNLQGTQYGARSPEQNTGEPSEARRTQ